jgi:16S rRNA (guanine1516-N2)-methyltransferase
MQQAMQLYYEAPQRSVAQLWQQRLAQLAQQVVLQQIEQLNARFLRQQPQLSLWVDAQGLWLCANGMKMQPAWIDEIHRLKRASLKNELLLRACQIGKTQRVLDATAGLGHDGLLLAWAGAQVTLIERHPILFALLQSNLEQALQHPVLQGAAARIQLLHCDSYAHIQQLTAQDYDVIYLDPMFPQRHAHHAADKKQAQVKKQMQLLHLLLPQEGVMDLGENLLPLAQSKAPRVIVKRPKHAVCLAEQLPQHQWQGDACRFDGYFNLR